MYMNKTFLEIQRETSGENKDYENNTQKIAHAYRYALYIYSIST